MGLHARDAGLRLGNAAEGQVEVGAELQRGELGMQQCVLARQVLGPLEAHGGGIEVGLPQIVHGAKDEPVGAVERAARQRLDGRIDLGDQAQRQFVLGRVVEVGDQVRGGDQALVPVDGRVVHQVQQPRPQRAHGRMRGPAEGQRGVQGREAQQLDAARGEGELASHQRLEPIDPGRDLRPAQARMPEGLHHRSAAGELAHRIRLVREAPVAGLQALQGPIRRDRHQRAALPVAQPGLAFARCFRDAGEPVDQGLAPPLSEQVLGVRGGQPHAGRVVAGLLEQREGLLPVALALERLRGATRQRAQLGGAPGRARLMLQKAAKQRVELEHIARGRCRDPAPVGEEVTLVVMVEQAIHALQTGQPLGERDRDQRQEGQFHQRLPVLRRGAVEHALREVAEHMLQGLGFILLVGGGLPARARQEQRKPRRPAVRARLQRIDLRLVQHAALARDGPRLGRREAQRLPVDQRQRIAGEQRGIGRGRLGAAEHEDVDARRHLGHALRHDRVEAGVLGHLLEVVEHQRRVGAEAGEQVAEEAPREAAQVGQVLGGQQRQLRGCAGGRQAQVIDEGGGIGIGGIDLVPDAAALACLQVTGQQRGLARAGLGAEPDQGTPGRLVEQGMEARARQHVVQPRPRELGECYLFARHALHLVADDTAQGTTAGMGQKVHVSKRELSRDSSVLRPSNVRWRREAAKPDAAPGVAAASQKGAPWIPSSANCCLRATRPELSRSPT